MSRTVHPLQLVFVALRVAVLAWLTACELDSIGSPGSTNEIAVFDLQVSDNPKLAQDVIGVISDVDITLNVPADTDVTSLVPTIQHTGEQITPASGEAEDFTEPVSYTVIAADGSERVYSVSVFKAAASSRDIRAFRIEKFPAMIDGSNISVTVPYATDLTMLRAFVTHTGVSLHPEDGSKQDFSAPVVYTVTAQDGSTKTYTVTVSVAPSNSKDITAFAIANSLAEINGSQITLTLPHATDPSALEPIISHTGASLEPASGSAQDFRGPVTYTVTAADGSSKGYTVVVSIAPSDAKSITLFGVAGHAAAISGDLITLTLPFGTQVNDLAPFVQHTGKSVSPASGAPRDFSQPVAYTVTAEDGSTKHYTVTLSVAANTAKSISEFVILGSSGEIDGTSIALSLPYGTDPTALVPSILHDGASIDPASGVILDFSEPVDYTVTAADGSTRTYTVSVSVAKSSAKEITQFKLLNTTATVANGAISVTLPYGSDVSAVAPQLTHTGASIDPASGQARDFRSPQSYTVTAENGSTRIYTVTVSVASSNAKDITHFTLLGTDAEIDGTDITLTVPHGTDVRALTPDITHTGASVDPAEADPKDFTEPVQYTVTAANSSSQVYTVHVSVAKNNAKQISAFSIESIEGMVSPGAIALTVPFGTNVTALAPSITFTGTGIHPASATPQNFSSPVTYTVTAEDQTTKDYVVTVTVAKNTAKEITHFEILGKTANISATDITLTLPYGTDPSALVPSLAITGKKVEPASDVPCDFGEPITFRVTAADDSYKEFTVTLTIARNDAKRIIAFSILSVPAQIGSDSITLTLPFGTDPTGLAPTIGIDGDAVEPLSNIPQDFSSPRTYTVTASDGSEQEYTVTVHIAKNDAKNILTFNILGVTPTIGADTITLTVPYGTNPAALTPTISISGVGVTPNSGVEKNFTDPVAYSVVADDGSIKMYTVTVTVAKNFAKDITAFSILNIPATSIGSNTISLTVPYGTDPSALTPTITKTGVSVSPASGTPNNFSSPAQYMVTADDGTSQTYTVTVHVAQNFAKDLTGFLILGVQGTIGTNTVAITLPYGTNPNGLTPTIASSGASVSPATATPNDFANPATYVVTAEDGTTKPYTVTVTVAKNFAKEITDFVLLGVHGTIGASTIALTLPYGTDPSSLTPTISTTGKTLSPANSAPNNFANPTTYDVTAEDGSINTYTVTVTVAKNFAKEITAFSILNVPGTIGSNTVTLTLPYGTDPTALMPAITKTGTSVSPANGAPQNFTNPVIYTVTAEDGSMQAYTVTVTVAKNFAKEITDFVLLGVHGTVGASTIALTLPYGTNPGALTPTITTTGKTLSPANSTPNDFANPATYVVTAEDGTTKPYTVTVTVAKNFAKEITDFEILGVHGTIGASTIALTLPYGTDPSSLTPTISTTGKTLSPANSAPNNFANPTTYDVTAEDGSINTYTVTVTVAKNFAKEITAFSILNVPGTIGSNTVTLTLPYGTDPTALMPAITKTGTSVSPANGAPQNFTNPVIYTVTAEDGSMQAYTVTVTVAKNFAKEITDFVLLGVHGTVGASTIALTLPYGTNPGALTPTISTTGKTLSPANSTPNDFANPATYVVTAEDGTMQSYTVTVTIAKNTAKDITSFTILGAGGTIGSGSVTLTVPYNTNLSSLTPTIGITGVSINPADGTPQNFTNPVMYTVTADDGSMQQYTVTVTAALNSAKDISTFSIMGLSGTISGSTVTLTVPYGIDLTNLTPTITTTGATVSPATALAHDFSSPTTYTVTADNSTTKPYTVTVSNASAPVDCRVVLTTFPTLPSGTYKVDPDGVGSVLPFNVYCDQSNNGGGWTLIGKTAAGNYTALSNVQYLALIANPGSDVNDNLLQTAATPSAGQIAFYSKAKTNALYNGSGSLRAIRVTVTGNLLASGANGTFFQQRVGAPANWDFWAAMRNSLKWNRDGSADTAPNDAFVKYFGTDVLLTNQSSDFNSTSNVVTHRGDGSFGFFATYTHTLNDASTLVVSRHLGLLNDGVGNIGYMWLLTADPVDVRWKDDSTTQQKSVIWLR